MRPQQVVKQHYIVFKYFTKDIPIWLVSLYSLFIFNCMLAINQPRKDCFTVIQIMPEEQQTSGFRVSRAC